MFEPSKTARAFGVAPGVDFPASVVTGLVERFGATPQSLAQVEVFVNTRRMQRRMIDLFDAGPARLLPRIKLITDLANDRRFADIPPAVPRMQRQLELVQLVSKLIDAQPNLAPRSSVFDLAQSLGALLDELAGEGVDPQVLFDLDVSDVSGHWQRSLEFVKLIEPLFDETRAPGPEARSRAVVRRLMDLWRDAPPQHPMIIAGSTGSRGTTAQLMQAVAQLPQGAVILPGFDCDAPKFVWDRLQSAVTNTDFPDQEDHPQFRFAKLLHGLNLSPPDIPEWRKETAHSPARNRLMSLVLRPAPITDQWMTEGKRLEDIDQATADVSLIQAPSGRIEASAIAMALRHAAEQGVKSALISPDRVLTRQVTAALDRWGITPDDSAGRPLPLTAPGRFLRHVARLLGQDLTSEALFTLLKHPLTSSGGARGTHLLHTRELELWVRYHKVPFPTPDRLHDWADDDQNRKDWVDWLVATLPWAPLTGDHGLTDLIRSHIDLADGLASGPSCDTGGLWDKEAGQEAAALVAELRDAATGASVMTATEYAALFDGVMRLGEVRAPVKSHPNIMIWGTLEARVQGADLVILAGLNEGTWPEPSRPDPWMNRPLRHRAGLLLPEREIGLAAHDFQQAIAAKQVILSRALRGEEAETVPSRWLNRMSNFLGGVSDTGTAALDHMLKKGQVWVDLALEMDQPDAPMPPAPRPSPQPPVPARPDKISVTEVQTLIRDPYAVYARRVLGLNRLEPLHQQPDAPLRGTVLHKVFEKFVPGAMTDDIDAEIARLLSVSWDVLQTETAWPATRRLWLARLQRLALWFIETELKRRETGAPLVSEPFGDTTLDLVPMQLFGKIDRIDRLSTGELAVYDYKTGSLPSADQQKHFDKQLLLSALILDRGGVADITGSVSSVGYIGLGSSPKTQTIAVEPAMIATTLAELQQLLAAYLQIDQGYTARRAVAQRQFTGNYDHLARFGEWDEATDPTPQKVGDHG